MERGFKGMWIPAELWLDDDLSWLEKLYLLEIHSLDNEEQGCYASNSHFHKIFGNTLPKVQKVIESLQDKQRIAIDYRGDKPRRHMHIIDPSLTRGEVRLVQEGQSAEAQQRDEMKDAARKLFFQLYSFKAREMTGRTQRADGKPMHPKWSGKEGSLFKSDYEQFGYHELKRMYLLFFADQVEEVRNFTKHGQKAGYGYSVFHGMIEKLNMAAEEPKEPCWECGSWRDRHYKECPHRKVIEAEKESEKQEIEEAREYYANVDLMAMFREKTGRNYVKDGEDEQG